MENQDLQNQKTNENIRIMGLLLLIGMLVPYVGGWLLVILYYLVKKDSFNVSENNTFWEIMNFNLSFLIYGLIAWALVIVLVGLLLLPIVGLTYFVLLFISIIKYLGGDTYKYPGIIRFTQ